MFDFIPQEYEKLVNIIFLVATALIARHGITYRKEDGERDFVRLLFGCIAATYFFLVLFKDVLGTNKFLKLYPVCALPVLHLILLYLKLFHSLEVEVVH